jgi:hypothetical protein
MTTLSTADNHRRKLPPWRRRLLLGSISASDTLGSQTVQKADPQRLRRPFRGN